jgi:hypothetical protein
MNKNEINFSKLNDFNGERIIWPKANSITKETKTPLSPLSSLKDSGISTDEEKPNPTINKDSNLNETMVKTSSKKKRKNKLLAKIKKRSLKLLVSTGLPNPKLDKEINKVNKSLNDEILHANKGNAYIQRLPTKGKSNKEILDIIEETYENMIELPYKSGALSGCVYGAQDNIAQLSSKVFEKYCWSNPMHADVFPDVRKMEAEVVRWVLNLFHGDENACGTVNV